MSAVVRSGMRRATVVALALVVLLAGCSTVSLPGTATGPGGDGTPPGTPVPSPAPPEVDRTVTVERVVDGDTLKISYANGTEDTVRLIGVDTPEVHAENDPPEFEGVPDTAAGADCLRRWGERASAATKELDGRTVGLAFDTNLDRRGYYGRLLAYVVVDGGTHNFRLVRDGHARVYDSSFSHKETYLAAERRARAGGVGLWTCAKGTGSGPTATASSPTDESATATATRTGDGLVVAEIHEDAAGHDGDNLNDEYVVLANRGDAPLDVSGWTVADEAGHEYAFPAGTTVDPGATVTVHTGSGTDSRTDVYWGAGSPVWNNDGDAVTVRTANGSLVTRRSY